MFRYICSIVLSGGKSLRMGICKSFISFNSIFFLDRVLNFFFDLGFIYVYISGNHFGYFCISDKDLNIGPLSSFYSVLFNNISFFFTHFLFIPVDMSFLKKSIVLFFLLKSKKMFSYCCKTFFFPILISLSLNTKFCIFFFYNFQAFVIFLLLRFFLLIKLYVYFINRYGFWNINMFYDLFFKQRSSTNISYVGFGF